MIISSPVLALVGKPLALIPIASIVFSDNVAEVTIPAKITSQARCGFRPGQKVCVRWRLEKPDEFTIGPEERGR